MKNEVENKLVAIRVSCPLCKKFFPDISRLLFNIAHEPIDLLLKKTCPQCGGSINQRYWTERGIDGEIRLCIGNKDEALHPVTTLSGMLTRNGEFDLEGLKIFKRQGLELKIFNDREDVPKSFIKLINSF